MTGKRSPGDATENGSAVPDEPTERLGGSAVLRWRSEPLNATEVCLGSLPSILEALVAQLNCRVMVGLTEDLTTMVLRVYHQDHSLAVFPRSDADWTEIGKWVQGPTLLEDVLKYGDAVEEGTRRRRRR